MPAPPETIDTPARRALRQGLAAEAEGRDDEAFAQFREATRLDPRDGLAWRHLGNLLRRAGELGDASACFERAIAAGDDPALNRFFLSAIGVGPVVPAAPPGFVRALYDQYAARFDAHLLGELRYRAPEELAELLAREQRSHYARVLDLGCGTGLAGVALRGLAGAITGVDLSPDMLAQAERTGAYAALVAADLDTFLDELPPARFDLVVACDVFIYRGDLAPTFAAVRRVLAPGGAFAFTVEACDAELGYDLLPTLRYAHGEAHLRACAAAHGFTPRAIERRPLREQRGEPVDAFLAHLVTR